MQAMVLRSPLLSALLLLVLLLAALCPGSAQLNLITNGGFETGDFSGFSFQDSTARTYISDVGVHSGYYCAVLGSSSFQSINQTVYVTGGQSYLLSFYLNRVSTGSPTFFDVFVFWADGNTVLYQEGDAGSSGGYQKFSSLVVAPGTGMTALSLVILDETASGEFYLDDLSLVQVTSIVPNGGFENGNFNHWTLTGSKQDVSVQAAGSLGQPLSGTYFASLGSNPRPNNLSQTVTVAPGSYLLSFSLQGEGGNVGVFKLVTQLQGEPAVVQTSLGSNVQGAYTQYVLPLTVPAVHSGANSSLSFTFVSEDSGGALSLDDVSLVRTDTVVPDFPLVCNGGFEAGTFACWNSSKSDEDYVDTDGEYTSAHTGFFFAFLGSVDYYNLLQQQVTVSSDTTYLLSFWLSVGYEDLDDNGFYAFVSYPSQQYVYSVVGLPTEGYKQHFAVVSTFGVSGPQQITIGFYSFDGAFYLGLDDVSLVPALNLMVNGDFEKGVFRPWQSSGNTANVTDSSFYFAYSGNYVAALGAVGSPNTLSQTVSVTPGANYSLQFWLSGTSHGTANSLLVSTKFKKQHEVVHVNTTNVPAGFQVTTIILPAFAAAGSLVVSFVSQVAGSVMLLDAVSFVRLA